LATTVPKSTCAGLSSMAGAIVMAGATVCSARGWSSPRSGDLDGDYLWSAAHRSEVTAARWA